MSHTRLRDLDVYVRSKNAGPFWITIDIFCGSPELFNQIKKADCINAGMISRLFDVEPASVKTFVVQGLSAFKMSFPRPVPQGHTFDRDQHSGQYFVRLLDLPVDAALLQEVRND